MCRCGVVLLGIEPFGIAVNAAAATEPGACSKVGTPMRSALLTSSSTGMTPKAGMSRKPLMRSTSAGGSDAIYLDGRSDPRDVMTEISLQSSFDGGKQFLPRLRPPSGRTRAPARRHPASRTSRASWRRSPRPRTFSSTLKTLLRIVGGLLALVGVGLIVCAATRRDEDVPLQRRAPVIANLSAPEGVVIIAPRLPEQPTAGLHSGDSLSSRRLSSLLPRATTRSGGDRKADMSQPESST